jgi:predicted PurR-regulated permease PerM
MQFQYHTNLTLEALRRWLIAQCYDSLLVSGMWLGALLWLRVPWAPFWALVAGGLQWIPYFGLPMSLSGPAMAMLFSGAQRERWLGLLAAYAAIALVEGLLLQPYLMRRQNRVPVWASLLTPIALGVVMPFWGVLFAAPLLAVLFAHRNAQGGNANGGSPKQESGSGEQEFSERSEGVVLPPDERPRGDA